MRYPSEPTAWTSLARRIIPLLICSVFGLAAPRLAWSQTSHEGDRLLNAGLRVYQQGQLQEAFNLWERARAIYIRDLGEDHPSTLSSMNNLAEIYSSLGQHDKARGLQEQTLKLRRAKLGENHADTLNSMVSLGNIYGALGEYDKALALNEQTLKLRRAKLGEDHPDTLGSMNNLASTYSNLGQYDKALVLLEQTLKLRRAKLGEDHPNTITSMSNLASAYSNLGQYDKELVLKDQILKLMRAKLGEDHPVTLTSMGNLALTYNALGQHDKALALNEQTLRLRRAKLGEDHPATFNSMNNLAATYSSLGQYDKALVLLEQTLKLRRAKLGEDHTDTLNSLDNLAVAYGDLGRRDKVLALNEQVLKLKRVKLGEDHPNTLSSMSSLASTYNSLGQYGKMLALEEHALKLSRVRLGDGHPNTLILMSNLAVSYGNLGQYDQALVLHEETLKLRRTRLGEDHPGTLTTQHNIAVIYSNLGQHGKALALTEQTLKLRRIKLGEDHSDTLASMSNLAEIHRTLGQFDKALALNEQTLKLRRAKLGEDAGDTRHSISNLALIYNDLGQFDKARAMEEQVLKRKRAALGDNHPSTLFSMEILAAAYRGLGQHDKALALIPEIVAAAEKLRTLPELATAQRQSLFAKYSDDYQGYAKWYAGARRPVEAFNLGDISKARTLTDSIKTQAALRSLSVGDQQKLQASETRAQKLQADIDALGTQGPRERNASLKLQKQLNAQNAEHLQLIADLISRYPKYAQITSLKPATASQARQLLGKGEVFVSYLVTTKGMAQAFVLDASGDPKWVDLGKIENLAKLVAAYREQISPDAGDGVTTGDSSVAGDLKSLNRYWHDTLIKPVLPLAGRYKRWIISPDKDLALLPFDTLIENFDKSGKPGQTLMQNRNITLVQSFAVFGLLKQREVEYATLSRPKDLFAMGNAVYGDGWAEARGIRRGGGKRGFVRGGEPANRGFAFAPMQANAEHTAMSQLNWQNLPGTESEIKKVSAIFGGNAQGRGERVDSYLGAEASESKLLQLNQAGQLKDYRYLLFSAHGFLSQNAALSSLVLSQKNNPPEIDGYVRASEWPLYDIRSDLTVLSACDTGVGRTQAGESVMGLPYALFVAGNKNTLLSLWPVDDDATAEFMRLFFSKIKTGTPQPEALRQTKQQFMQHAEWSDPRFWAAFVLYGL